MNIIWIDMHIRDERVLEWILGQIRAHGGEFQIGDEKIASQFDCHRHTARAIMNRLKFAGKIEIETAYRGGKIYREPSKCANSLYCGHSSRRA